MTHAWLIIAHNEFDILQRLVSMLDAPGSDIYIHFDKKVRSLPDIRVEHGKLVVLEERIDVRWGTVSQIETELLLLETAHRYGNYSFYHILSGTHLPLVPYEELSAFYAAHSGEEVMRFWPTDAGDADFKLRRYHFPIRDFKSSNPTRRALCQKAWTAVIKVQKILDIKHMKGQDFYKTDNWMSLSDKACRFLVGRKAALLKKYRWSFCGDEYFVASELMAKQSEFRIFDCPNLLYVEFQKDTPRTFFLDDYSNLQKTGFLWARKFSNRNAAQLD